MISELKGRYEITRPIWLMPILESALGIENASAIAMVSKTWSRYRSDSKTTPRTWE